MNVPLDKSEEQPYEYSKSWEVTYLKEKCQKLGIEGYYERYRYRLRITNISLLMCGDSIIVLSHILLLLFTVDKIGNIRVDIFYLLLSLMLGLFILTVNFSDDFVKSPSLILCANVIVVLIIVSRDIVIMSYHKIVDNAELSAHYSQLAVVTVYYFVPLSGYIEKFVCAQSIYFIYTIQAKAFYYNEHRTFDLKLVDFIDSFFLCSHIMGIFYMVCYEYIIRISLLNRYYLLEETIVLKLVMQREKSMIQTVLPTEITRSMQEDVRRRIKENSNKYETSLDFTRTLFIETHNEVSILFADMVNFTHLTTTVPVKTLVELLHELFVQFDTAAESFSVMRIKFLGDCYICVAGIPLYTPAHAKCCVDFGLEMIQIVSVVRVNYELNFDIRIGVHSGAVFSGVIGTAKWHYDIWSKDVDIANRMEHYGVPAHVHVSQDTLNLLDDCYIYKDGTESAREDEILKRYNMATFVIIEIKEEENGYPSREYLRKSRTSISVTSKRSYSEHHFTRSSIRKIAIAKMEEEVEKMPIGRMRLARIFDFSIKPEGKAEDIEFQTHITYFWLMFRRRSDEWIYMNEPDDMLKYSVIIALFLSMAISLRARNHVTFSLNYPYYVATCLLLLVLSIIVTYKKLWLFFISKSRWDEPSGGISLCVFKLGDIIKQNFFARIIIYFSLICILFALCCIQMINCDDDEFRIVLAEALLMNNYQPYCFEPDVFTYALSMVLLFCYSFRMLPLMFIVGVSAIVFTGFLIVALFQYGILFERTKTSNLGFRSEYSACFYLLCILILLFLRERKNIYMAKVDFVSKRRMLHKQTQINMATQSINIILNNMLPPHVAEKYFANKQSSELFFEEFPKIATMFASIKNYDPEKTGIRILNEFICYFDDLLLKYYGTVEKIKVASWTYMACCGLDMTIERMSSYSLERLTGSKGSMRFSTTESKHSFLSRKTSNYILEDDVVVLIMTEFALDLLNIMTMISKLDMFKNSQLDSKGEGTLQIGISHGPVMAGVVGRSKPHYDIWGNAVNMASRMDTTGEGGRIQVTENTAKILQGYDIQCDYRGKTYVKGVGDIPTYFVATDEKFDFVSIANIEYAHREFRRAEVIKKVIEKRPRNIVYKVQSSSSESDWESDDSYQYDE